MSTHQGTLFATPNRVKCIVGMSFKEEYQCAQKITNDYLCKNIGIHFYVILSFPMIAITLTKVAMN